MGRAHYAEQLTPALTQPLIDLAAKYNGVSPFLAAKINIRFPLQQCRELALERRANETLEA